ncbi:MAG TPA: DUF4932 domain-containing protein, partial [Acidobacteriota bacterium]|nr:DUF4932 domain-containing protein [Acidobacteriota bacterium]
LMGHLVMASEVTASSPAIPSDADSSNRLTVSVDPRIELLAVVQLLSDYKGFNGMPVLTQLEFPYRDAITDSFSPFKDHKAVRLFSEMSQQGFWYGQPPHSMLHLGSPPQLKELVEFDPFIVERAGGQEKLELFLDVLRDFAVESRFMEFFNANAHVYEKMVASYRERISRNYIADIEQYFGVRQRSYNVVLAPLFHCGGFGPRIKRGEGVYDVYNLGGPCKVVDGEPEFGSEGNIRRLFWHEFGHSFVSHLTDQYVETLLAPSRILLGEKFVPDQAEVQVAEFASEHILRAVTTRLAILKLSAAEGQAALETEQSQGFPLVEEICRALVVYEKNRDRYATLADFYPELILVFDRLAREEG